MLLQDSQRGGAKNLSQHLLKEENDHVEVHELRGFISQNLTGALNEIYAASRATRAKKFMYSVSFNPPANEHVSTSTFIDAVERVEKKMQLVGQPRAIVFHEKYGRRHAHVVWSRIDTRAMKSIELPFTKLKLKDISHDLFIENGWQLPPGYANSANSNPLNYTMAQWQQARRAGKRPQAIKRVFVDSWAMSASQEEFAGALRECGYVLARGDRRGFVALDHRCEPFSVSRWAGLKAKQVRGKLKHPDRLPSMDEARLHIAQNMQTHLGELSTRQDTTVDARLAGLNRRNKAMIQTHRSARAFLLDSQKLRTQQETAQRQQRLRGGLKGVFDFLTGRRAHQIRENQREAQKCQDRDSHEMESLRSSQLEERRSLVGRIARLEQFKETSRAWVRRDLGQYQEIAQGHKDKFERATARPRLSGPRL